jgi:hypothetical protein
VPYNGHYYQIAPLEPRLQMPSYMRHRYIPLLTVRLFSQREALPFD